MAHSAAISMRTLMLLYSSADGFFNFHSQPSYTLSLYKMATSIQTFDFEEKGLQGKEFEKEIRDALWKVEDIIESYVLRNFLWPENFTKDLLKGMKEIESIKERMNQFAEDFKNFKEISNHFITSSDDLGTVHKNKMVGIDAELELMKNVILGESSLRHYLPLGAIGIWGMGGIGKTSLAISIYNDLDIRSHFSVGAWVKIPLEHSVRNILLNLLYTMEFFDDGRMMRDITNCIIAEEMNDEKLADFLREKFMLHRYLVMVDCLCDINLSSWDYIKSLLPDSNNGSRILLVSRMRLNSDHEFFLYYSIKGFLNESQSWNLLQQQVFGDETCEDSELEEMGKRIAKNCQGLPLAIITVGFHLAKEEKTVEYWNKVAESGNSVAYAADGAPMYEQLGLSYKQMPQRLRPIFLYMGAFPESHRISISELQSLWVSEVLWDLREFENPENMGSELCDYFLHRDLLIDIRKPITGMHSILELSLHHAMWYFCCNQAEKEEFFCVFDDCSNEGEDIIIKRRPRRLVIRKTLLFGFIKFIHRIKHSLDSVRSMLFTGPYHPYPLSRISWGCYTMLRVLNASSIRFYEFPADIFYLKLLRYLALTLNGGDVPSGISKLRNLLYLIVSFHHTVISCEGGPSYLPIEIWEMKQLFHLQVMGHDLPSPPHSDSLLPNLVTLSDVSPYSCQKEVLERIPNLRNLKMSINLAPKRNSAPMCLFNNHIQLENLCSAHFVVTNPYFEEIDESQGVAMLKISSFSMKNLQLLRFSGCGLPWKSIEPISQLPFLEVLELRSHAFRGTKWELTNTGFSRLKTLILEDLDLVYWTGGSENCFFPLLTILTITDCLKLEEITHNFVHCPDLTEITVLDSSQAAEIWAWSIEKALSKTRRMKLLVSSQRGESIKTF